MESKKFNKKTWMDLTESSRNLDTPIVDLRRCIRQRIESGAELSLMFVIYELFAGKNAKLSWGMCCSFLFIMAFSAWWLTQDNSHLFNDEFSNYLVSGNWEDL